jgi:uncharacterized pyridoxamine 5'-phosphate oxidase family protein
VRLLNKKALYFVTAKKAIKSFCEVIEQEGVIFCDCKKSNKVYFVSALKKNL